MDAHAAAHGHEDHAHPTPGLYGKIAAVLFVLTALEVLAFEVGRRPDWPMHALIEPLVVPILLILSAAKFALVAMFYMHLKQDSKLFSNLFVWPLIIAAAIILALIVLHAYWIKASF
ncbi:MAG: cytochrome C oxidase subunit IV [Gemmatimonadetes bacterium]|nr:cytochrome C oxidase subunit IV [Gemmatimonadota bacterium]